MLCVHVIIGFVCNKFNGVAKVQNKTTIHYKKLRFSERLSLTLHKIVHNLITFDNMKESDSKPYLIGMAIPIRMTCLQTDVAIASIKSTGKNDIVFLMNF